MKLSAKKKGEIYDLIHKELMDVRTELLKNYTERNTNKFNIDYLISQLEIPLAQKLMALLDPEYKKEISK
jgi:hypothetical protein